MFGVSELKLLKQYIFSDVIYGLYVKIFAQVAGYCEKVASLQDRRAGLYHALEEAILKLKANKDIVAFQNTTKRIGGILLDPQSRQK